MPRINILTFEYEPLFVDGRIVRIKALVNYLVSKRFDVSLFSLAQKDDILVSPGLTHHQIGYFGMGHIAPSIHNGAAGHRRMTSTLLRLLSRLIFPDRYIFSLPSIVSRLNSELSDGDTLLISMPWFSSIILCAFPALLSKRVNIVLDFRDLWANNRIFVHGFLGGVLARWIEKRAISRCCLVTVTTTNAKKYFDGISGDSLLVSNGITRSDIETVNAARIGTMPCTERDAGKMILGYFGNLGGKRNCSSLLKHLKDSSIHIRVYGKVDAAHLSVCQDSYGGSLSREECLSQAHQCDALLVVIRKAENSDFAIPGKIYEYVVLGKPIVIYCPRDALALSYLVDMEYPHLHIDSEGPSVIDGSLVSRIISFYEQCQKQGPRDDWEVPVREAEYEKFLLALEQQGLLSTGVGSSA